MGLRLTTIDTPRDALPDLALAGAAAGIVLAIAPALLVQSGAPRRFHATVINNAPNRSTHR